MRKKVGLDRDLNPGPLAPEARIIPLDHLASHVYDKQTILEQTFKRDLSGNR